MSELKPCPFCGNEPQEITLNGKPLVVCWGRGCVNDPKNWNTRPIEDALNARIAELKGVIEILEDQQREVKNILIDKNLHIDSLYEEGYKLQQRIAELEAAQRWIPVSERLPEEDCDVLAVISGETSLGRYYKEFLAVCDFIDGLGVIEATHWMPLPQPPEVQE